MGLIVAQDLHETNLIFSKHIDISIKMSTVDLCDKALTKLESFHDEL
jgi:hypothetical protein